MNRQKIATFGCIVLSIAFSLSLGLFIHFRITSTVYEKTLDYSETLYKEYQEEAERMIAKHEYSCQYPTKTTFYSKNGQTTLVIEIGEYDKGFNYSDYITATVKNFGTAEQKVTFERSRKSAEEAYESARNYRNSMYIFVAILILILIVFTIYLINNSIKKCYRKVFIPIIYIIFLIVVIIVMRDFLLA